MTALLLLILSGIGKLLRGMLWLLALPFRGLWALLKLIFKKD